MAGRVPAIHAVFDLEPGTWMAGTNPAMTFDGLRQFGLAAVPEPWRERRTRCLALRSAALLDRNVMPLVRPHEELSRAHQLGVGILEHLLPLRDPANGARDRE
jgi:hypothetical protein